MVVSLFGCVKRKQNQFNDHLFRYTPEKNIHCFLSCVCYPISLINFPHLPWSVASFLFSDWIRLSFSITAPQVFFDQTIGPTSSAYDPCISLVFLVCLNSLHENLRLHTRLLILISQCVEMPFCGPTTVRITKALLTDAAINTRSTNTHFVLTYNILYSLQSRLGYSKNRIDLACTVVYGTRAFWCSCVVREFIASVCTTNNNNRTSLFFLNGSCRMNGDYFARRP